MDGAATLVTSPLPAPLLMSTERLATSVESRQAAIETTETAATAQTTRTVNAARTTAANRGAGRRGRVRAGRSSGAPGDSRPLLLGRRVAPVLVRVWSARLRRGAAPAYDRAMRARYG